MIGQAVGLDEFRLWHDAHSRRNWVALTPVALVAILFGRDSGVKPPLESYSVLED